MFVEKKKKIWITKLDCRGDVKLYEKVLEVCLNISQIDETFGYEYDEQYIYIISDSRDQAYQRGSWFHNKISSKILYRVYYRLEKEV